MVYDAAPRPNPPATALTWVRHDLGYPDMRSVQHNTAVAESAGYKVLTTYSLPGEAWVDGYYDVLGPRATALLDHPDPAVREFAAETVREIEVFQLSRCTIAEFLL